MNEISLWINKVGKIFDREQYQLLKRMIRKRDVINATSNKPSPIPSIAKIGQIFGYNSQ